MKQYAGWGDRVLIVGIYVMLLVILLLMVLPVLNIVASSLSSPTAVVAGRVSLWPVEFSLKGFTAVAKNHLIVSGFGNSLIYTVFGTALNLILTMLLAYPLSVNGFAGKKLILGYFLVTMFLSGGMVPSYLLMKDLRLLNTRWVMIVPSGVAVYNAVIARTYMRTSIDSDLYGAAEIDGCSDIRIFLRIVLPLSKPIIAVFWMMYAVGHWNSFFGGLMYLRDEKLFPLQLVLRRILILNEVDMTQVNVMNFDNLLDKQYMSELIKYSSIVVATLPMMLLYPFIQKYFVKGIMLGSLKG